jgi:glutamine synthetase adenylyltransferase
MLDLMMGRSSALRWLEDQKRMRRLIETQSAAARVIEQNRRIQDLVTGPQSVLSQLEGPNLVVRVDAAARAVERSRKLLDAISQRSAFAAMLGMNHSVGALMRQAQFSSLVAQTVMPGNALKNVLDQLRDPIGGRSVRVRDPGAGARRS